MPLPNIAIHERPPRGLFLHQGRLVAVAGARRQNRIIFLAIALPDEEVVLIIPDARILIVPPSTPTRIRFKKSASRTRSCVHVLVLSGCCIAREFRQRRRHQWLMQGSCIPQSDGPRVGTASLCSSSMKNQSSHEEAESRRGDIWQQARRPLAIDFHSDRRPVHLNAGPRELRPYP